VRRHTTRRQVPHFNAIAPHRPQRELSVRGIVLGVLITTVFTAANVYLGLKVGLTFATSIPRRRDLDGGAFGFQGRDHPREQHRADVASAAGHSVGDHLCAAWTRDCGLVARLPVLDLVPDLRLGRHSGRLVHHPAPARDGNDIDLPYPKASPPRRCSRSARMHAKR